MFYSHILLARKAPLGQIWWTATTNKRLPKRNVDNINLVFICNEIMNPAVPMALRLSSILMGGVAIVYQQKVQFLQDDANHLLLELNSAWKKRKVDRTVLPKNKRQAKYENVTLPEIQYDVEEVEPSLTSNRFIQETGYRMRLDAIDELTDSFQGMETNETHHQADPATITLDPFNSYKAGSGSGFCDFKDERFVDGEEETAALLELLSQEANISLPTAMEPAEDFNRADEFLQPEPEKQADESSHLQNKDENKAGTKVKKSIQWDDQTMIPNNVYQSWLKDPSDLCKKRPSVLKGRKLTPAARMKKLMNMAPSAIFSGLVDRNLDLDKNYPKPLRDDYMATSLDKYYRSGRTSSPPRAPNNSSTAPLNGQGSNHPPETVTVRTNQALEGMVTTETMRTTQHRETEHSIPEVEDMVLDGAIMASGHSSGGSGRSYTASPTTRDEEIANVSDNNSGRLNKKRHSSNARLESLDEENHWIDHVADDILEVPRFKMPRSSNNNPTPDDEQLVVEVVTEATETQHPAEIDPEAETMTEKVATQLKTYFEAPGAPQTESLDQLTHGMNRRQAAQLFYQTCVLATRDVLKVKQTNAYGEISISRGSQM